MPDRDRTEVSPLFSEGSSQASQVADAPQKVEADGRRNSPWAPIHGCRVTISVKIPDSTVYYLAPDVTERLRKTMTQRSAVMKVGRFKLTLGFVASATDPMTAMTEAQELIPEILNILNASPEAVFDVWFGLAEREYPEDQPAEAPSSGLGDGVGVGEAAEILGVSKQRVHQLAGEESFPKPILRLKATPVWQRWDVEQFARTRNVRPGPRSTRPRLDPVPS